MECQIILTCDDLEKNSGTNVAANGFFCHVFTCFSVLDPQTQVWLSMAASDHLFHAG